MTHSNDRAATFTSQQSSPELSVGPSSLRFLLEASHGGAYSVLEMRVAPGFSGPPMLHHHTREDVPDPSMTAQARRLIARLLPSGTPDVERLARGLSVSRRTLQRRLADEGTTVRALIELTREELARR